MLRPAAFVLCAVLGLGAHAQYAPADPEWNRPIEPFRIAGNLYYVGSANVSSFLIATSGGLILLDTGFREAEPALESNIRKLGFRLEDVRLLLISHAHCDHVGAMAGIKARTKARLLASPADAPLLARGGKGDFAFEDKYLYPPVAADALLADGEPVRLGDAVLTPRFTPGHTKGSTSWTTTIQEGERRYRVVIAASLSAPGYRLVDNPRYPEIVRDYRASFATLRALPCDIFLSMHSWDFELDRKIRARAEDATRNPFVDPEGYRRFLDKAQAAFEERLRAQGGR